MSQPKIEHLNTASPASGDFVSLYDLSGVKHGKATIASVVAAADATLEQDNIITLQDDTGGSGTDTLAALDVSMVAVDGSGMTAAQETEYDAAMVVIADSISSLADKIDEILLALEAVNIIAARE